MIIINVLLLLSATIAAILAIRGETYKDGRFTGVGWVAIFIALLALGLGIWKESLVAADAKAAAQANADLKNTLASTKTQLDDAKEQRGRLQQSLDKAQQQLMSVPKASHAFVPINEVGEGLQYINGVPWRRYRVFSARGVRGKGSPLILRGGETVRYTVGWRGSVPRVLLGAIDGYLLVGEWRYPLHGNGELQVVPASNGDMPVFVWMPGE